MVAWLSIGEIQVPVQSPLRSRLASILSALVRFNLRRLLNPPPLSYTKPSEIMPFVAPVPSTDRSEVSRSWSNEREKRTVRSG